MAKIKIDHKHGLDDEAARSKLEELVEKLGQKYKLKSTWQGDAVELKGTGVKGDLRLSQGKIAGVVDVPFFLKGKVEKALAERLDQEFPA